MLQRRIPAPDELDADLREVFLEKPRVRWTHTSIALESKTLPEGETFGVARYGLFPTDPSSLRRLFRIFAVRSNHVAN